MSDKKYSPQKIEAKWQKFWEEQHAFRADDNSEKEKYYVLVEFPYPSGSGLHVGHVRSQTAMDIVARKKRLDGYNVLYPIGWDAFGLPTENFAIKNKIKPQVATEQNINNFKQQIKRLGISFDWSREINTTDPSYYKWTQWIFLQFFKKGLAYKAKMPINWCPSCKIGLANEEVIDGKCERCGEITTKKELSQWMLKITQYADRLIDDLKEVDYLDKIKTQQINWIGRSEGAMITFSLYNDKDTKIDIFTTRPDTLFGVTYLVLAPEHKLMSYLIEKAENKQEIDEYIEEARKKSDLERSHLQKEKTGVEIKGVFAINPANAEKIPLWVADYVLANYGTGAVMAVPAHDQRDYDFARKYNLPIIEVIANDLGVDIEKEAFTGEGTLINSGQFNGMSSTEARKQIINWLEEQGIGKKQVNYRLRDWVFSRQHYWGEPIPIVYCEKCGVVPVPEENLPVILPDVDNYEPTDTGESPLSKIEEWVNTSCPKCSGPAKRETDTMPNWAGSSWYYLRYIDPHNDQRFADMEKMKKWLPVNLYNGGMEHTTLHLLYSRFWHKFLYDQGLVPFNEPYKKRISHGMVLAEDGQKMSKSRGNVVNPDEVVSQYGADTVRVYEMFMGPYDEATPWSTSGIKGVRRFLEKVYNVEVKDNYVNENIERLLHKTIKKVTEDIDNFHFNTAISAMMVFINEVNKQGINKEQWQKFLLLLYPFAPHLAEELNSQLGEESLIYKKWPAYDENKLIDNKILYVVQINGKVRAKYEVSVYKTQEEIIQEVKKLENIAKYLKDKKIIRIIFVKGKLVNFVIG